MARIIFDDANWPVVIVRYPREITPDEWREHLACLVSLAEKGRPFATLADLAPAPNVHATMRRELVMAMERHDALFRSMIIAAAQVVRSPLVRGAMTAVNWIRPPPFPARSFGDEESAYVWLRERVSERAMV